MRLRCEVAVQEIFPVARAELAKRLLETYDMSQVQAAKGMGISQPAISQYKFEIRGRRKTRFFKDPRFMQIVDDIAKRIANGTVKPEQLGKEFCRFCKVLGVQGDCE